MDTPAKASPEPAHLYMLLAMIRATTKRIYQSPRQLCMASWKTVLLKTIICTSFLASGCI